MTDPGAPPRARRLAWLLPALAYAALIFWLSSLSAPLPRLTASVNDKVLHLVEYAGLAILVAWGIRGLGLGPARAARIAAVVASLYGLSDEFHQSFVPNRSAELADWAADTVGAIIGALLVARFLRHRGARASIRA